MTRRGCCARSSGEDTAPKPLVTCIGEGIDPGTYIAEYTCLPACRPACVQGAAEASAAGGRVMIQEVSDVVESNFLDARGAGFDPERWRAARDRALARPLRDTPAVHM